VAVGAALALIAAPAEAKDLGATAPTGTGGCTDCWFFSVDSEVGSPSYGIPAGKWRITSWSTTGDTTADASARLLVFRPGPGVGQYRLVKMSSVEQVPKGTTPTFATSIRVRPGDRLGLQGIGMMPVGYTSPAFTTGDRVSSQPQACSPPTLAMVIGAGTACSFTNSNGHGINLSATIAKAGLKHIGRTAPPCPHGCPFGPPGSPTQRGLALHSAPGSPSYVVPHGHWRISSWQVRGGGMGSAQRLLVYRRTATAGQYRLIAETAKEIVPPEDLATFAGSIRVRGGDRLGLETTGGMPAYFTGLAQDKIASMPCLAPLGKPIGAGTGCPLDPTSGGLLNLAATLKPAR
jgi:hypothetical protein